MDNECFIEREFVGHTPAKGSFSVSLRLGQPQNKESGWACSVEVRGLGRDPKPRDIYGADSLQAFMLAIKIARGHIEVYLSQGGTLSWPGEPHQPLSIEQILG
jgi:hypothetical protein